MKVHKLEPLWHVYIFIVTAVILPLLLPSNLVRGPRLMVAGLELMLILGISLATPRAKTYSSAIRRGLVVGFICLIGLVNVTSLELLIREILRGDALDATRLVLSGVNIAFTNTLVFALLYWEMDGGGPGVRLDESVPYRDFKFVQMDQAAYMPEGWFPTFIDYVYVSATNALAFSPTDTMPLTRRAKVLMLIQSLISVCTLALVVARAVNILGN